jgi:hypothetical protein
LGLFVRLESSTRAHVGFESLSRFILLLRTGMGGIPYDGDFPYRNGCRGRVVSYGNSTDVTLISTINTSSTIGSND